MLIFLVSPIGWACYQRARCCQICSGGYGPNTSVRTCFASKVLQKEWFFSLRRNFIWNNMHRLWQQILYITWFFFHEVYKYIFRFKIGKKKINKIEKVGHNTLLERPSVTQDQNMYRWQKIPSATYIDWAARSMLLADFSDPLGHLPAKQALTRAYGSWPIFAH
jgi:hypothetical protein